MCPWQRQPGEPPDAFTAFAAYLRLKGRRSHAATAARTGRSLGSIRRLSAQWNWPARVTAFDVRLAEATQDALDGVIQAAVTTSNSDLEQFRIKEFLFARQVIHESHRWLQRASDPRRRQVSLMQVCRLIELAFKLQCLAVGMPGLDAPQRRPRREDAPGYWAGPSIDEALKRAYGSDPSADTATAASGKTTTPPSGVASGVPTGPGNNLTAPAAKPQPSPGHSKDEVDHAEPASCAEQPTSIRPISPPAAPPVPVPSRHEHRRRDVWSAWAAYQRRLKPS